MTSMPPGQPRPDRSNPDAPFGRDDEGNPLAPLGFKVDGKPRMDRRGANLGQAGVGNSARGRVGRRPKSRPKISASTRSMTDLQRKSILVDLANDLLVTPLASLSRAPFLSRFLGTAQTDALAGDALIVHSAAPAVADVLILFSKNKPKALAWMEKIEDNAALVLGAQVGVQIAKAVADNHMRPNPQVAEAGRNLAAMRIAEIAEEINRQAAQMHMTTPPPAPPAPGPVDDDEPTQPIYAGV